MNGLPSSKELDAVFGSDSKGATPAERAASSKREFVRSQSQIALDSPEATGMRLKAEWAHHLFSYPLLRDAVFDGAASVIAGRTEPAATLRQRREDLGLKIDRIARASNLREEDLIAAETAGRISSVQQLHRYAQILGLDEEYLGYLPGARADTELGVRLRQLGARNGSGKLSPSLVLKLSEAAWIIGRQHELSTLLNESLALPKEIVPSNDYGAEVWRRGFELAARTRAAFNIKEDAPIEKLRALVDHIGIPLIQAELGEHFAGATVANRDARGIVVNVQGANSNVWVRRTTVAHELGHLLWDPNEKLKRLRVDTYDEILGPVSDPVESRANAFAIGLLAPPVAVRRIVAGPGDATDMVAAVMQTFGLALTGARRHVSNVSRAYGAEIDTSHLDQSRIPRPSNHWEASESWTVDFFPVASTPISRRGRFAALVVRAAKSERVSLDSAASWLGVEVASISGKLEAIDELYA